MSNVKYQHHNFDAIFLVSGRNVTFIAASIISAFINLFFIGNLSHETYRIGSFGIPTAFFLSTMSVTLECSKLFHVIQYNSLKELYHKLQETRILKVARQWFIGYIFYAILAILSATFFSFNSLGVSAKQSDSAFQYITEDYNTALSYISNVNEFDTNIELLNKQKFDSAEIDKEYIENIAPMIQRANEAITKGWRIVNEEGESVKDPFESEWSIWYKNEIAILGLNDYGISNGSQVRSKLDINLYRTIKQQSIDREILSTETAKASKEKELNEIYIRNNVTTFRELETSYRNLDKGRYSSGGTAAVFKLIGDMIGIDDSVIRCGLLFFLSLLIELTIFQTSPKVQISRRMLYQFTQYLPKDFNVNKFMNDIDKELVDYDIIKVTKKDEKELIKADVALEKAEKQAKAEEAKARRSRAKKVVRDNSKIIEKKEVISMPIDPKIEPIENTEVAEVKAEPVFPVETKVEEPTPKEEVKPTPKKRKTSKATPKKTTKKPSVKKVKAPKVEEEIKEVDIPPTVEVVEESVEEPVKEVVKEVVEEPKVDTTVAESNKVEEEPTVEPIPTEEPKVVPVEEPTPKRHIIQKSAESKDIFHEYRFGSAKESVRDKMILLIQKLFEGAEFKVDIWKLASKETLASLDSVIPMEQVNVLLLRLKSITYGKKFVVVEENGRFYSIFDKDALIKYATAEKK